MNADEIASQAYEAWELLELDRASELFSKAAKLESSAAQARVTFASPDRSFLYELRSAICAWDSGERDCSRTTLLQALTFDWKGARMWGDRRDTEMAFVRLLLEQSILGHVSEFIALWKLATARGEELSVPFPFTTPHQKKLLIACRELKFVDGCRQVVSRIDPKRLKTDHELQLLVRSTQSD